MELADVYPLLDIELVKGEGLNLWDAKGTQYLDFYGGHAVISIGHSHPHYIKSISKQLEALGYYSNSVQNPLQKKLAQMLGSQSGYDSHRLFLCNSGAEAIENALKVASFHTGKRKFIVFQGGFHGRTSAAVAATDDSFIQAPLNKSEDFLMCPLEDKQAFDRLFQDNKSQLAGVLIEGIQGIGGIFEPSKEFMEHLSKRCREVGAVFICDEIQSGYGRTGTFFAHQHHGVKADIVTVAKGMGNGFPIAGVLIAPDIALWHKMLGTTFGGNHLACSAAIAVLEVLKDKNLEENAKQQGAYLIEALSKINGIKAVRGRGLMIALDFEVPSKVIAQQLRSSYAILVGSATNPNTMRLLPSLTITRAQSDYFINSLEKVLQAL